MWEIVRAGEIRAVPELLKLLERALEGFMPDPEGIASVTARTLARLGHTDVVEDLPAAFADPVTPPTATRRWRWLWGSSETSVRSDS